MDNQNKKACFKCHATRLLKECQDCKTVFCVHCAALPFTGGNIPELPKSCVKCGSTNVANLEQTFKQK